MQIEFPDLEPFEDTVRQLVEFPADVEGRRVLCRIPFEAIQDSFEDKDPVQTFIKYRSEIEAIARTMIESGRVRPREPEYRDELIIRSEDVIALKD